MKKISTITIALFCLTVSFTLSGCAELFDCIASARPNLPSKTLSIGQVGMPYNESIQASVTNDPYDNGYDYYLSINDELPPGISYYQEGRRIIFTGTPTSAGTYTFRVDLTIDFPESYDYDDEDDFGDDNNICFGNDSTSKNYTIVVQ